MQSKQRKKRRSSRLSASAKEGSFRRAKRKTPRVSCEKLEDRLMMSVTFIPSDLEFILRQISIAEQHAAGADLTTLIANSELPFGLRTVDGSFNNLLLGQTEFGAADNTFLRLLDPVFTGPYIQTGGVVIDGHPRIISNLIVDQTAGNPAAVAAAAGTDGSVLVSGTRTDGTTFQTYFIPNVSTDVGLSAPFNAWMTFFGQFFDHGLDLVSKGGSGTIFMPLQSDDPLFDAGPDGIANTADDGPNFLVLTRATNLPGPDGVLGNADDIHEHLNQTTPFVDQNQTYSSHPSHQVFLREYRLNGAGRPVETGRLVVNRSLGTDGEYGTSDDVVIGGMATWAVLKAQARDMLGVQLTDADVLNVPLLAADPYGNFLRGPNGYVQIVTSTGLVEGNPLANGGQGVLVPGNAFRTGHAFMDDIAHTAAPGAGLTPDGDTVAGGPVAAGNYDNELLDAHYVAGDGRVNENIGLTTVHHVFHSEHNRLVEHVQDIILSTTAGGDVSFLNQWLATPVLAVPADLSTLQWNGQRLFQAAKFGTEMQYQHLVFEEFARTIQPNIDVFLDFDGTINPAIFAEFAHTVYRFGHSMLNETVDRLDPDFVSSEIGLIQAFLNPLEFAASGPTPDEAAGAIVRGVTRQVGNAIDEFVTEALRNNLLGLPMDLAAINMARARDTGVPSLNAARREFFQMTSDAQLAPYTSWADFGLNIKHPESLVNFVAAYGTHASITNATTTADKRAAAALLVLGGEGEPADRLDFLHSTGAYASGPDGLTTTGLDAVDFWIGGLAERIMPFGGMLGSSFNFVFETQLENLQNGDRFYYLHRTPGMNFFNELENNSFAKMIMAATDATHLPALVFSTPGLTLEVDQTRQFNLSVIAGPDGLLGTADDVPGSADPLGQVIRDNPATPGPDTDYLRYTGDQHVVLGGTAGNDILIASEGDDTLWGDEGNDRLEGGFGNDTIEGGAGDDIITDIGGDDVLKGDAGNDVIQGGNGLNLIISGPGKDFVITGRDITETFAGPGDDFILGTRLDGFPNGNEGNDWIEGGLQDGGVGDNFDPLAGDAVVGHDVFLGDGGFDEAVGEGGDDIVVGSIGPDKYKLGSGFDWVTYKSSTAGVRIDMFADAQVDVPLPPSQASIVARFAQVEGLSGSPFADVLLGDDATAAQIVTAGATGSVLTNIDLISGLRDLLGAGALSFNAGNILLGGAGSDIIEGRGGDDIIDGDRSLNVRISVRQNVDGSGPEIATYDSMVQLAPLMLGGVYNPGQLVIVREILTAADGFDTAVFSDVRANYTITTVDGVTTVAHVGGLAVDGTDRLTNIERLRFADESVVLAAGENAEPTGLLTISDTTPTIGQTLTVLPTGIVDADGVGTFEYVWQFEPNPGSGIFQDIQTETGAGLAPAIGPRYTVTGDMDGLSIRVRGMYQDGGGTLETVFSAPTAAAEVGPGPAVVQALQNLTLAEDAAAVVINLANVFSDLGDTLSFAGLSDNPSVLTTSLAGNLLTLNVVPNASGVAVVTVQASDSTLQVANVSFVVTVQPVNDAPTFTTGADQTVLEDSGAHLVVGYASGMSAGPADEAGQTLSFLAVADNPALFQVAPAVSPNGDLTYTLAPNANGSATVSVYLQDNGGTANGGLNTSAARTLTITIVPVNDRPAFTAANPPSVNENAGPQTVPGWITSVTAGAANENAQTLQYEVSAISNPGLFAVAPAVSADGTLTYTPAPGVRGMTTFAVTLRDDGGTANSGVDASLPQTFTLFVNPVVQLPQAGATNRTTIARLGNNIRVVNNSRVLLSVTLDSLSGLTVLGVENKSDVITVDSGSRGGFALSEGLLLDGRGGIQSDSVTVMGTAGADVFRIASAPATEVALQNAQRMQAIQLAAIEQLVLNGGRGNDAYGIDELPTVTTIRDASGIDTLTFAGANRGVDVNLGLSVPQTVLSGASTLRLSGRIENAIGSAFDDSIQGNSTANRIRGGAGNDVLRGAGGNDIILGEAGSDLLQGDTGRNVLAGGDGDDTFGAIGLSRQVMIGGRGSDNLLGNGGSDLLIPSHTIYDQSEADLLAIMTEWASARSLDARLTRLSQGLGASQTPYLRMGQSVLDDGILDSVLGGNGGDAFMSFVGDSVTDVTSADRTA